jgi:DNA-binding response OmpR family regulator
MVLSIPDCESHMEAIVVGKDQEERDVLVYILRNIGFSVAASSELKRMLDRWTDHPADLLVVALSDGGDPLPAVDLVRGETSVPLLMIVERGPERTFCELLRNGADVVLERPVSPQVLGAYAQALLRRSRHLPSFVVPALELADIALDPSDRSVTIAGGEPRRLTQLEFSLLYLLMTNRGLVIPVDVIVERVWGYTGEGNRDLVRGLISRLRHKIERERDPGHFIETVTGVGYRFVSDHS